ncbi:MAG: hypothetical protein ABIM60_06420 [candidate division WOR-3 bacterium]
MKKVIFLLFFLFSYLSAIEEKPLKEEIQKLKGEEVQLKDDKDEDGILDVFIKNIIKKSEMKKEGEVKENLKEKKERGVIKKRIRSHK